MTAAAALSLTRVPGIAAAAAGGSVGSAVGARGARSCATRSASPSCVGLRQGVRRLDDPGERHRHGRASTTISFRQPRAASGASSPRSPRPPRPAPRPWSRRARAAASCAVLDAYGQKSEPGKEPMRDPPASAACARRARCSLADAEVSPRQGSSSAIRSATLSFVIGSGQPSNDLRVDVVTRDGARWCRASCPPASPPTRPEPAWNGTGLDGRPVPSGWYSFRISSGRRRSQLRRRPPARRPNLGVAVY